ncbi:hypothetical protein SmJEL517_g02582 [Synchytrium microbalum]|uniref:Replication factor C subunit 3 n=1 Tax=Synchytrium microbalum TaxID=1806994 RepID=A0A507C182_9FUNG|nr:uncharacterized protein SmJEL517_g02582 [Synchytrium microbalum]TPX34857.1 hypothetical protein SmJEL517_g02582 [Synchytrium microbalum]
MADEMDVDTDMDGAREESIEPAPVTAKFKGKGRAADSTAAAGNGKATEENLPWVEKYRPSTLDELISHKDIISTITKLIDENRLPHLLLYGPPGTGKTSTVLACAKRMYGAKWRAMVLELNASDDRGIDAVRDQIKTFAESMSMFKTGVKMVILDEADNMTQQAQAALRRVIEKYTKNVRFALICNYVSKIIPAIQSRCTRFRFGPLVLDQIEPRLEIIVAKENVTMTTDGKAALLRLCKGDMRRVLNVLQATHAAFGVVSEDTVYTCTGAPLPKDIERIMGWMFDTEYSEVYANLDRIKLEKGLALADIIGDLSALVIKIDLPPPSRVYLLEKFAEIEFNISTGCSEKIQMGGLIGAFKIAMDLAERHSVKAANAMVT